MPARRARVSTNVRFEPAIHEALRETADELGVGVNWLINKFCEEGLDNMDLTSFTFVRPGMG
jgi:predicted DNA-binding ribbon-helix-helix protein